MLVRGRAACRHHENRQRCAHEEAASLHAGRSCKSLTTRLARDTRLASNGEKLHCAARCPRLDSVVLRGKRGRIAWALTAARDAHRLLSRAPPRPRMMWPRMTHRNDRIEALGSVGARMALSRKACAPGATKATRRNGDASTLLTAGGEPAVSRDRAGAGTPSACGTPNGWLPVRSRSTS